jgi:hypothetical protein
MEDCRSVGGERSRLQESATAGVGGRVTTAYEAPIESAQVMIFARSVGDVDACYTDQIFAATGTALVTPLTFVRALDHFNPASTTRPTLPVQTAGMGGRTDTLHAEQHFEYFAPFCAGDRIVVESFPGGSWQKTGRAGVLEFSEMVTEYRNQDGTLVVRARKVSVRMDSGDKS